MRQPNQTTVALAIGGILLALVFPWTLAAQEDKFIDCRERPCDVEDIVRALQPVQTPQSPTMQYRGIPTTTNLPAVAVPAPPPPGRRSPWTSSLPAIRIGSPLNITLS